MLSLKGDARYAGLALCSNPATWMCVFTAETNFFGIATAKKVSMNLVTHHKVLGAAIFALITAPAFGNSFPASGPTIPGNKARLRDGVACAPTNAPLPVKRAIWAANQLHRKKPYRYGGGHRSFADRGYDCSGTVSYALGGAGLIKSPLSSSDFHRFGQCGQGKWITIYTRRGHTFAVIAGLRLDTTPYRIGRERWAPGWQVAARAPIGFEARHPVGL